VSRGWGSDGGLATIPDDPATQPTGHIAPHSLAQLPVDDQAQDGQDQAGVLEQVHIAGDQEEECV